ncbi:MULTISPECIES: DUF1206 domain-containing protein [unclassified Coleofasciculus]|uniref:DUF1206 domain-containing protein n=1 Tax=unclassified Coleofasciculus TaxID=2692782 RepID=UPI00187F165B|nr:MULTISPECIES: DUF1206 domain-containing protein [unclassified Coleofasciculus]MBE9124983.1 DUF1206 domain-containing protein [Coleofasciculus sp. LEGE 07081]MBE9148007.1 DUF1206 domain-containing protein [Coleofasciculus sp. LEGE 07092]
MWIERLARFGYTAKGIVYAIIGWLAVQAAFGSGGKTTDSKGVLTTIAQQPFGQLLLGLLAFGLIGYVVWRFVQAIQDPEHKGHDADDIVKRIGYAISGLIYASLAFTAIQIIIGANTGGGTSKQTWVARLLAQPFGQWLLGAVGALIIGYGFYEFYKAYKAKFRKKLKLHEMSDKEETVATYAGRIGLTARGIVFIITGFFVIQAARQYDASEVRGIDGVLQTLASQPYGPWLLGIMAIGLIAYGIHMFVQAQYRRIKTQ